MTTLRLSPYNTDFPHGALGYRLLVPKTPRTLSEVRITI